MVPDSYALSTAGCTACRYRSNGESREPGVCSARQPPPSPPPLDAPRTNYRCIAAGPANADDGFPLQGLPVRKRGARTGSVASPGLTGWVCCAEAASPIQHPVRFWPCPRMQPGCQFGPGVLSGDGDATAAGWDGWSSAARRCCPGKFVPSLLDGTESVIPETAAGWVCRSHLPSSCGHAHVVTVAQPRILLPLRLNSFLGCAGTAVSTEVRRNPGCCTRALASAISPSIRLASFSGRCAHGRRSEAELTTRLASASHAPSRALAHPRFRSPAPFKFSSWPTLTPRQLAASPLVFGLVMFHQTSLTEHSHAHGHTTHTAYTLCTPSAASSNCAHTSDARPQTASSSARSRCAGRHVPEASVGPPHRTNCLKIDQQE
jgi:hypothetical protein